jgi:hypothetical protein
VHIGLRDGDGSELLRCLQALYPITSIAITGYGMPDDVARCEKAGFRQAAAAMETRLTEGRPPPRRNRRAGTLLGWGTRRRGTGLGPGPSGHGHLTDG